MISSDGTAFPRFVAFSQRYIWRENAEDYLQFFLYNWKSVIQKIHLFQNSFIVHGNGGENKAPQLCWFIEPWKWAIFSLSKTWNNCFHSMWSIWRFLFKTKNNIFLPSPKLLQLVGFFWKSFCFHCCLKKYLVKGYQTRLQNSMSF